MARREVPVVTLTTEQLHWILDGLKNISACESDESSPDKIEVLDPSRINNSLRFQSGIAPPCEQLRGVDPYAPCHRRNARTRLHAFGYRLSLELI